MSDRSFSRRRRGGLRFRPSGGLSHHTPEQEKAASEARALATGQKPSEEVVFDMVRHAREIERSENIAAGLPPDGSPRPTPAPVPEKRNLRESHSTNPDQKTEETGFRPVPLPEPPVQGFVDVIRAAANKVIQKVQLLVRPSNKIHKEIVINVESLETRVAVCEEGKLEEFTIERSSQERLVGSIFKGKVKNLEDGLKAAFVDIGFEKNAFLHYWDIVPSSFDSSVEIVERPTKKRDKPRITQKDIPRLALSIPT